MLWDSLVLLFLSCLSIWWLRISGFSALFLFSTYPWLQQRWLMLRMNVMLNFIILYHNILVMLYDGHPSSTIHASFNCVVKTLCLAHVSIERPFGSCIRNVIFNKSSLKTVSMYGSRVLVFVIRSIAEFFQLSIELEVVMSLQPHVLLYFPYIGVLCKRSSYNLVRMHFHEKWMFSSSIPWGKVCFYSHHMEHSKICHQGGCWCVSTFLPFVFFLSTTIKGKC